jgi:hypothetical protein
LRNKNQRILRTVVYAVCTAILLTVATFGVLTLCDVVYYPWIKSEFFASTNGVADRLLQCVVLFLGAFTIACIGHIFIQRSREKEKAVFLEAKLRAIKEKTADTPLKTQEAHSPSEEKQSVCSRIKLLIGKMQKWWKKHQTVGVWSLRAVIFTLSAVLLIVGVCNGGMKEVLLKAINICTQCIGLG